MDIASLLQPISPTSACGQDLSFSADFDSIADMRRQDDPTLDQGEWKRALKVADWPGVVSQASELLRSRTKDLRLAGWLVDATARTDGLAGIADGLELYAGLCEMFWDEIHPRIEDGDAEQRIGNLGWLLAQLPELSRLVPLIDDGTTHRGLRDIDAARATLLSTARDGAHPAGDDGATTMEDIARTRAGTPRELLAANVASGRRAQAALARLESIADDRLGADGPGFIGARKALEDLMHEAERLLRESSTLSAGSGNEVSGASDAAGGFATAPAGAITGPLKSRSQAIRQLRAVAAFFRQTEPHSPVAYLADKAAQWGEMPLHAWLRVVLKDPNALAHVEELLGVESTAAKQPSAG